MSRTGAPLGAGTTTAEGSSCVATFGVHIHNGIITGFGGAVSICVPTPPVSVNTFAEIDNLHLSGNSSGIEVFNGNGNSNPQPHHDAESGHHGRKSRNRDLSR